MPRGQVQVPLQIGREQPADRIADDKSTGHHPASGKRVAEQASLKDTEQWSANLAMLSALQPPVLEPDRRFLNEDPDVDKQQRRQYAEHQQAAPADRIVE